MAEHLPSKLLTPSQVAEILGVSVATLATWRATQRYDLAFTKVGRLVRYDPSCVFDFVARRTHRGAAPAE